MHTPCTSHAPSSQLLPHDDAGGYRRGEDGQQLWLPSYHPYQAAIDVETMGRSYGYLVITPTRRPSTWRRWAAAMVT
eukprot:scaffold4276_cov36-Phaeocystis_antarctica.AAC.2